MKLNEIRDNEGARKARVRKGRGPGSGKGKTAARGYKGQKSRSGVAIKGFEGGQMPLHRRLPKRGFNNVFAKDFNEVNVGRLQKAIDAGRIDAGKVIDTAALVEAGVIRRARDGVRVQLEVAGASKGAREAIEKAGGKVAVAAPARSSGKAGEATEKAGA